VRNGSLGFMEKLLRELESNRTAVDVKKVYEETWLAQEMVRCHRMDLLCWYIVYGRTGAGKSTYAVMSLAEAARSLGFEVDWSFLDRRIIFSPDEVYKYFEAVKMELGDKRDVGLIMDDAGVHFHAYKFFTNIEFAERISSLLQVARVYTANIVVTTPNITFILRMLRSIPETYYIPVARRGTNTAVAAVYVLKIYPPNRLRARKLLVEEFDLAMPYHEEYQEKRRWYADVLLELGLYKQLQESQDVKRV